jgi:hypothetical protein
MTARKEIAGLDGLPVLRIEGLGVASTAEHGAENSVTLRNVSFPILQFL